MVYDAVMHSFSFVSSLFRSPSSTDPLRTHLIWSGQKMVTSMLFMKQAPPQKDDTIDF